MHPGGVVIADTDDLALAHMLSRLHARLGAAAPALERDRQLYGSDRHRGNRIGIG
ncbi:hypothetical protein D9M68_537230 [compost metagenome]